MRLITYLTDRGPRLAVVAGDHALDADVLSPGGPVTIEDLLHADDAARLALRTAAADDARIRRDGRPLAELRLLAPVPRPGKVVAIGRNYRGPRSGAGRRDATGAADLRQVVELRHRPTATRSAGTRR